MKKALLVVLLLVGANASAADLDSCFHVVPSDSVATLQADLDCSATTGVVSSARLIKTPPGGMSKAHLGGVCAND